MSELFWRGDGSTKFEQFVARLSEACGMGKVERVEVDQVRGEPEWLFEASALAGEGEGETCAGVVEGRTPGEAKYNLARRFARMANAHAAQLLSETFRPLGEEDRAAWPKTTPVRS